MQSSIGWQKQWKSCHESRTSQCKVAIKGRVSHLEILKAVVEKALEDGQLSIYESKRIRSLIWADGKVTYKELRIISETIYRVMGDTPPDLE